MYKRQIHPWAIDHQRLKLDHQNQVNYTNHPLCSKLKILSHQLDEDIGQVKLLIQFRGTGERYLEIEKFRDMLQIDSKYSRFVDLKRRVIVPAVEEINTRTGLLVSWEPHKLGRQVQGLRFHFAENPQKKMAL